MKRIWLRSDGYGEVSKDGAICADLLSKSVFWAPFCVYLCQTSEFMQKIRAKNNETHSKSLITSWPVPPVLKNPGCKKSNYSFFLLCMPPVAKDFQWHPKSWPGVNSSASSSFQSHTKQSNVRPKRTFTVQNNNSIYTKESTFASGQRFSHRLNPRLIVSRKPLSFQSQECDYKNLPKHYQ